jgi:hypothetical protein
MKKFEFREFCGVEEAENEVKATREATREVDSTSCITEFKELQFKPQQLHHNKQNPPSKATKSQPPL